MIISFFIVLLFLQKSCFKTKFTKHEYKAIVQLIEEHILSTDLTNYFIHHGELRVVCDQIDTFPIDWNRKQLRKLVRSLMMTAADISGQAKPFNIAKRITQNVMTEFYNEGRLLKEMNHTILPIFDSNQAYCIPMQQIEFLKVVCLPCFHYLSVIFPNIVEMENLCK